MRLATMACLALPAIAEAGWVFDLEFGNFGSAKDIAVDSKGEVYVADGTSRVQVFTPDGQFLREETGFTTLRGIAIDENDIVYINDACRVYRYTTDLTPLGSWDSCIGQGDLQQGFGIDADNGFVWVATSANVNKFTLDGVLVDQFDHGWSGIDASADGTVWVSNIDLPLGLVRHYAADGAVIDEWPTALPGEETSNPTNIAVDSGDEVFVNDSGLVKIFHANGKLDDFIEVQLRFVDAVELDGDNLLYVGTSVPGRVMKFHQKLVAVESKTWGGVKARFR
jgi:sugar lactone lactonase YvrE